MMKNKQIFFFCCLLLIFQSFKINGQVLDQASLQCSYTFEYKNDLLRLERKGSEEVMLLVGDKFCKFYSYSKFVGDSLVKANPSEYAPRTVQAEGTMQVLPAQKKKPKTEYNDQLFINRSTGLIICMTKLFTKYYQYEEPLKTPDWKVENSFEEILGFHCQKATASFKGRDWTAWFCAEIPVGEGPWKLRGLPGLILKAEDNEGHFRFTCSGFERLTPKRSIEKDKEHDYQTILREDLDKQHKIFFSDPNAFINNSLGLEGGSVKISGPRLKREYNPIDR